MDQIPYLLKRNILINPGSVTICSLLDELSGYACLFGNSFFVVSQFIGSVMFLLSIFVLIRSLVGILLMG